nr:helix-turn-helix domain-containing protein [Desulfovibrio aminophilus]
MGFRWTAPTCDRHFRTLDRGVVAVDNGGDLYPNTWSVLTRAAQAVYPVLLRHADDHGVCFPAEDRLAAMSGLTRKGVRAGVLELEMAGLLSTKKVTTRNGRRAKLYNLLNDCTSPEGICMPSIFIDGGLWSDLTPTGKALAVAFRYFAKPRPDLDPDEEGWLEGDDFTEYLNRRKYDICGAEPSVLREFSGVCRRIYLAAIESLQASYVIEPHDEMHWRVLIWPPKIRKVSWLNSRLSGESR